MSLSNTNITSDGQIFKDKLKQFIVSNNVIGTTAGVSIGIVTKDLIVSLVGDIIIPGIILLCFRLNIKSLTKILPGKSSFDFTNFFKQVISWIFIIIITFVFITYAFEGLLGINSSSSKPSSAAIAAAGINKSSAKESFFSY